MKMCQFISDQRVKTSFGQVVQMLGASFTQFLLFFLLHVINVAEFSVHVKDFYIKL